MADQIDWTAYKPQLDAWLKELGTWAASMPQPTILPPVPTPAPTPVPVPTPLPSVRRVPFGASQTPIAELLKPGMAYNATALTMRSSLKADLDACKSNGVSMLPLLPRSAQQDANGLSKAKALAYIAALPDLAPYLPDTCLGFYIADDITADEWKLPMADRMKAWDEIYGAVLNRWPSIPTVARAKPAELAPYQMQNIRVCWAAYKGPQRDGPAEQFRDKQVADAKKLGLDLVIWFNALDGGDGSSGILGTYVDAKKVNRWQCAAAEVLKYGKVFLPATKWAFHWQWSPIWNGSGRTAEQVKGVQAFDRRPDVLAAMAELRKLADAA